MQIKVLKFGGTSQKSSTYEFLYSMINDDPQTKYIIILSAISGITNKLLDFINTKNFSIWNEILDINKQLAKVDNLFIKSMEEKLWDLENDKIEIIAMGEFFTTNILNDYLISKNIKSKFVSSFDVIKSSLPNNQLYNKGEFVVNSQVLFNYLENNQVLIIPGFSGISSEMKPCLLGRGGSDTTGSIIAAAVNATEYQIWTDVDGIYSSDPRKVKNTFLIKNIVYGQAQEIAAMGAKVIHPFCILPCAEKNIPILIKNTFNENAPGTLINSNNIIKNDLIAVTIQGSVTVFKITSTNMWNNYGFVYDIFSTFKKYNVDVNIINTSQFNITTTTEDTHIDNLLKVKEHLQQKYNVEMNTDNSIISVIGENIRKYKNIGKLFEITQNYDVILTSYSSNDMTLSWVIKENKALELANELHNLLL